MTPGGWAMFLGSWAAILALNLFCFYRLFTEKPARSITGEDEGPSRA
jgi:hypothetical protein